MTDLDIVMLLDDIMDEIGIEQVAKKSKGTLNELGKPQYDAVTRPKHYCEGREYEPIKVIRDWNLNFNLGNAVKYISRAGRKDNCIEDLEKAVFYLQDEIAHLKK